MRSVLCTVSLMALAGCNQSAAPTASGPKSPGRFAGIGVFAAGRLWGQMTGSAAAKDPALAKLQDDEHIIVVMDSDTGEVRFLAVGSVSFNSSDTPGTPIGTAALAWYSPGADPRGPQPSLPTPSQVVLLWEYCPFQRQ